jgi:hypothetical protein
MERKVAVRSVAASKEKIHEGKPTSMINPALVIDSNSNEVDKEPRSTRLRTGLLVLGSALFGGIAVVLWNRRTLTNIQNQCQDKAQKPISIDDDAIY